MYVYIFDSVQFFDVIHFTRNKLSTNNGRILKMNTH